MMPDLRAITTDNIARTRFLQICTFAALRAMGGILWDFFMLGHEGAVPLRQDRCPSYKSNKRLTRHLVRRCHSRYDAYLPAAYD